MITNEQLAEAIQESREAGEMSEALGALVLDLFNGYVHGVMRENDSTEEVLEQAYNYYIVGVCKHWGDLDPGENPLSYLKGAVINSVRTARRKVHNRRRLCANEIDKILANMHTQVLERTITTTETDKAPNKNLVFAAAVSPPSTCSPEEAERRPRFWLK